jgi:hypothetical protein
MSLVRVKSKRSLGLPAQGGRGTCRPQQSSIERRSGVARRRRACAVDDSHHEEHTMSTPSPVLEDSDRRQDPEPVVPTRRQRFSRPSRTTVLLALLVFTDLAVPAVLAWQTALIVPTYHLDGAFQTASGMFRLADGAVPGRDFFPYLGIGPLYVLYPFFVVLGGDLTASVFAAHFVALVAAQFLVAVVVTLLLRRRSKLIFALAAAAPLLVLAVARVWPHLIAVVEPGCGNCVTMLRYAAEPGNSLRPLRAVAPYLLAMVAMTALLGTWRPRTQMITVGVATGLVAALWSNDYGLVSAALMVALVTGLQLARRPQGWMRSLLLLWGSSLGTFLVAGFLATAGHFVDYLRYNLEDVRGDQFWYFGAWDEQYKVFSIRDLLGVLSEEHAFWALFVLPLVIVFGAWRRRSISWLLVAYLGAATLLGGITATVGGHSAYYFWAFRVWAMVVVAVGLVLFAHRELTLHRPRIAGGIARASRTRRAAAVLTALALTGVTLVAVVDAVHQRISLAADPHYVFDDGLDGYLDARYADHVAMARANHDTVVEEYFGLWSAVDGPNENLKVDSVIHALGSQRQAFADYVAKERPDKVVTTSPEMDDGWTPWNLSANWWLYHDLLKSYRPEQTSPMALTWTRTQPAAWTSVPCRIDGYKVQLSAEESGLYEVALQYQGPGAGSRAFTMVRNYLNTPGADGYLALDPGATSQAFPVYVHDVREGITNLPLKDVPSGRRLTRLSGCTASAIAVPKGAETMDVFGGMLRSTSILPYWGTPVDVSFGAWRHGTNTERAAILLPRNDKDLRKLLASDRVRFSDGTERTIERLQLAGAWISVSLSGDALDQDVAAYPQPLWLEEAQDDGADGAGGKSGSKSGAKGSGKADPDSTDPDAPAPDATDPDSARSDPAPGD